MNNEKKRNPYMFPENTAKVPCKNCKKRVVGCHATCEEYQKYKKEKRKMVNIKFIGKIIGEGVKNEHI